jgi:hypothetical protein
LHLPTGSHTYDDAGTWEGEAHGVAQLKRKFYPEV